MNPGGRAIAAQSEAGPADRVTAADAPALELRGATATLGGRVVWLDVDVTVERGEFVAVLGPNGAGKSTLLRAVLGLLPLTTGSATVLGAPPGSANARIGYLPQRRSFDSSVRFRGRDIVRLGLDGARWGVPLPLPARMHGQARRAAAERVEAVIELVGAEHFADRPIGQLSGGEQQRLLIAQALVRRPDMLMLDEPLDSLDLSNQSSVAALVQRVCREAGVTVLLVAHDVNPILSYLDRVIYFAAGTALHGPPRQVITTENLSRLYGAKVEVLETSDERLVVVGQPEAPAMHSERHAH